MFNVYPGIHKHTDKTDAVFTTVKPLIPATSYSNLSLQECFEDEYETITIAVAGGLNGQGDWSGYLLDLSKLLAVLDNTFEHAYVIFIDNDCVDDVFIAHIAIRV